MTAVAWFIGDVICWVHSDEQLDCTHLGDQTANETEDMKLVLGTAQNKGAQKGWGL